MDLEDIAYRSLDEDDKRKTLGAAIHDHEELYKAVSGTNLLEQAMHWMSPSNSQSKMAFSDYYQFVLDQALVIDRNNKEGKQRKADSSQRGNGGGNGGWNGQQGTNKDSEKTNSTYLGNQTSLAPTMALSGSP